MYPTKMPSEGIRRVDEYFFGKMTSGVRAAITAAMQVQNVLTL